MSDLPQVEITSVLSLLPPAAQLQDVVSVFPNIFWYFSAQLCLLSSLESENPSPQLLQEYGLSPVWTCM